MPHKLVPSIIIALSCLITPAVAQDGSTQPHGPQSEKTMRQPPVAVRIEDKPIASLQQVPRPEEVLSPKVELLVGPEGSGTDLKSFPEHRDAACNQDTAECHCRDCRPQCPPPHWQVFKRLHFGWRTAVKPCLQASHWGYPEEFCERPFGSYVRADLCAQIGNGLQDQLILHRCDFFDESLPGARELKPRGHHELAKIVQLLQQRRELQRRLVVVCIEESEGRPELNEARRQVVLHELLVRQVPLESEQVVVGRAKAPGISGDEALRIYANLQKLWQQANAGAGGSGRTGIVSGGTGLGTSGSGSPGR